jgi:Septum formation
MEGWQPTVDLLGEDGLVTRRTTGALVAALAATLLVSGCGSALKAAKVDAKAEASATATQSAPGPPPPAPKVGKCYDLTYKESLRGTSKAEPVPCKDKHTSVTIFVGEFDPIVDGHLLAVDSDEVQAQIAKLCPSKVGDWVGGSQEDQRLSRFKATWFSPTLAASDAGADWFRCDLVAKRGEKSFVALTGTKGALDDSAGLDRFGTCSPATPADEKRFEAIPCAQPHTWRAVSVVDIPEGARYEGAAQQAAADRACKDEAEQQGTDPLEVKWAFQWPSQEAFDAGQRYGLCWVPDKA